MSARAWITAIGTGVVLGTIAALATSKHSRRSLGEIRKLGPEVAEVSKAKLFDFEQRAIAAGAKGTLTFIGAGAEGFVVCDDAGKAFKLAWGVGESLKAEAAWLKMAGKIQSIKQHVPRDVSYNVEERVLVRECLVPRSGSRADSKRLWSLHQRLASTMAPYGHGRPEFKIDSYVYTKRGPVLVDAGFAVNRGNPLVKEALALLKQPTISTNDARDMAFALRMERSGTIPEPIANRLLKRLQARKPSVEL